MNQEEISQILTILREINQDEFQPSTPKDCNSQSILDELVIAKEKFILEKQLRNALVEHLYDNMGNNLYQKFPITEHTNEFDLLSETINAYIDELEVNTINIENFNLILKTIPEKIFVFDYEGYIYYSNCEGQCFISNEPVKKYFDINLYVPKSLASEIEKFKKHPFKKVEFLFTHKNNDNSNKYLNISILPIIFEQKEQILFVSKDVTEQKKLELKSLKSNILGQDLERKRLASDLHDSLGQELGAIKFFLGSLKMMKEGSEEYTTCLEEIDRMVNDTINSVREITFDLMPFVLENNTLDKAIEQLCRKTNIIETIQVEFTKNTDTIQLKDKKEESFVYRIIQEFINNTIKHAHATKLIIDIQKHPNSIKFKLQDNGTGFKILINNRKNGLLIISQRLEILQSEYQWQSDKSGTTLEFTLYE